MKVFEGDPVGNEGGISGEGAVQFFPGKMECLENDGHEEGIQHDGHDGPDQGGVCDPPGGEQVPQQEPGIGIKKQAELDKLFRMAGDVIFNE